MLSNEPTFNYEGKYANIADSTKFYFYQGIISTRQLIKTTLNKYPALISVCFKSSRD